MGNWTRSSLGALMDMQTSRQRRSRFFIISVDMPLINIIAIGDHPQFIKIWDIY